MRLAKILGVACAMTGLLLAAGAAADGDGFTLAAGGGKATVTPVGGHHINKDYPWKLTCGATVLDKSKFSIAETSASVSGGSGACVLKGAVCKAEACKPFTANVNL